MTVPVVVSGKSYPFELAPQEVHSAVTQRIAGEAGAKIEGLGIMEISYAQQRVRNAAILPDVQMGSAHAESFSVLLLPHAPEHRPDGMLGLDFLSGFDLELDVSARKLKFFSPAHCAGEVVYWNKPYDILPLERDELGNLKIVMQLDGKPIGVGIDPQQTVSSIGTLDAAKYLGIGTDDPKLSAVPGDNADQFKYRFKTLSVGGLTIVNPNIRLYWQSAQCKDRIHVNGPIIFRCISAGPLLLGRNVLSALHLYFAFKEKNLYVTAADTPPNPQ